MPDFTEWTTGPLKALLVLGWNKRIWVKLVQLPFAPFPGLGIRIDVYDMLHVESVVVGDRGCDVTCICTFEETRINTPRAGSELWASRNVLTPRETEWPTAFVVKES